MVNKSETEQSYNNTAPSKGFYVGLTVAALSIIGGTALATYVLLQDNKKDVIETLKPGIEAANNTIGDLGTKLDTGFSHVNRNIDAAEKNIIAYDSVRFGQQTQYLDTLLSNQDTIKSQVRTVDETVVHYGSALEDFLKTQKGALVNTYDADSSLVKTVADSVAQQITSTNVAGTAQSRKAKRRYLKDQTRESCNCYR